MWNIIKSIFRYSLKHKVSLITLTFLTFLSTSIFGSLITLSSNLTNAYDKLVTEGKLNNLTIHELYSTTVESRPDLKGDAAKLENKRLFLNELDTKIGKENYRRFNSIDFNTTNSGFAYKIVQNDPNYTIDKLVIYEGSDTLDVTYDFASIIQDASWDDNSPKAAKARWMLIFLGSRATWTDQGIAKNMINSYNLIKHDPTLDPKNEPLDGKIKTFLQRWTEPTNSGYSPLIDKQYRIAFNILDGSIPKVGIFDNFSTYSSVVPSYILEKHNLEILPDNYMSQYREMIKSDSLISVKEFDSWMKSVPSNYKIKIDNLEYLVIGSGLSPSFMYPVYSFDKAIPNTSTEIFLFSNHAGFQMAYDSNRSSPIDDYLIGLVADLNSDKLNEINLIARKYMAWPSNINAAYFANDTNNRLAPAPIRVSFLPSLVEMQIGLSNGLSLFIAVLNSIVFIFSIRKFIEDNQDSLAILRANGVKKRTIVGATSVFGIFPSFVGGILGYIFTQFTQAPFISLYSQYWVVPTAITAFNPLLFFGLMLVPFAVMAVISVVFSWLILRKNASKLMSDNGKFKITPTGKFMGVLFAKADIITRFRASIAFSSLAKLLAITTLFTLVASALTFATAITDKFSQAKDATFASKKYNFSLDLNTPTVQGGQYLPIKQQNLGKAVVDNNNILLNYNSGIPDDGYLGIPILGNADYINLKNYNTSNNYANLKYYNNNGLLNEGFTAAMTPLNQSSKINELGTLPGVHFPTLNDSTFQENDLLYLKNRVQSPFTVDLTVGAAGLTTNPWDVARSLAPPNVTINADKLTHQLWTQILNDDKVYYDNAYIDTFTDNIIPKNRKIDPAKFVGKQFNSIFIKFGFLKYLTDQPTTVDPSNYNLVYKNSPDETGTIKEGWYEIDKSSFVRVFGEVLSQDFLVLAAHVYNSPEYKKNIFYNTYNSITLEDNDETYTRVGATLIMDDQSEGISVRGIKPNTQFIDLINLQNERVNDKLLLANDIEQKNQNTIHDIYKDADTFKNPQNYKVIINESAAYQYKLEIGSKITIDPNDEATRFNPKLIGNANTQDFDKYNIPFTFEVADIIKTYQYPEFYINQRIANHINVMDYKTILDTAYINEYIYDPIKHHDIGITPIQIDPFNGIFSSSQNPKSISNANSLYSASGIYLAADKFSFSSQIIKILETTLNTSAVPRNAIDQYKYMSKLQLARTMGFTDDNGVVDMAAFNAAYVNGGIKTQKLYDDLVAIYGVNPLLSTIYNVEFVDMYLQLFDNLSVFVESIVGLVLGILFSISIISVMFLSVEFISSAISVISILKVLGFYDNANAFAFLSMFFPATIIATAVSVPISMLLISLMQSFIYSFGSILLPMAYQWWYFVVPLVLFFAILGFTIAAAIIILKKQDITKAITR